MRFLRFWLVLLSTSAFGVEPQSILNSSSEESTLVGVIRDSQENSVALIKNNNRSYTLKVGDELPWKKSFFVIEISGKNVVIGDGTQKSRIETETWASNSKFETVEKAEEKKSERGEYLEEPSLRSALEDIDDENLDTIESLIEELDLRK